MSAPRCACASSTGRTQQEIGDEIGVSQMQVSRILRGALERARLLGPARDVRARRRRVGRPRFGHRRLIDLAIQLDPRARPGGRGHRRGAALGRPRRRPGASSFPAIVGPLLLVTALGHSAGSPRRRRTAWCLGLVALAGFAAVYGLVAARAGWGPSLVAGWAAAAVLALAAGRSGAGPAAGFLLATGALLGALRVLPRAGATRAPARAAARARADGGHRRPRGRARRRRRRGSARSRAASWPPCRRWRRCSRSPRTGTRDALPCSTCCAGSSPA